MFAVEVCAVLGAYAAAVPVSVLLLVMCVGDVLVFLLLLLDMLESLLLLVLAMVLVLLVWVLLVVPFVSDASVSAALSVVPICGCTTEPDTLCQKHEFFLT